MNEPTNKPEHSAEESQTTDEHLLAKGIGAVGGGVTGAALGRTVAGKFGAAVGGIAGAIAGSMAGNAIGELTEEIIEETSPTFSLGLGADMKPVELPQHYSWKELQKLSKPTNLSSPKINQ